MAELRPVQPAQASEAAARVFISQIPQTNFLNPKGSEPKGVKLFRGKTWQEARKLAYEAARKVEPNDSAWDGAERAAWRAMFNAGKDDDATKKQQFYQIRDEASGVATQAVKAARPDEDVEGIAFDARGYASLKATLTFMSPRIPDITTHMQIADELWGYWAQGLGYACEVRGERYLFTITPEELSVPRP